MAHERIEINPDVMWGKRVIRGTRIPVDLLLRKLGAGLSVDDIPAVDPRRHSRRAVEGALQHILSSRKPLPPAAAFEHHLQPRAASRQRRTSEREYPPAKGMKREVFP